MASKKRHCKGVKNRTKARAQFAHTARRLSERFDICMGKQLYGHFVRLIQEGSAEFVRKQSNRVTIWRTVHEEHGIILVYDKIRKTIVTAMPDKEYDAKAAESN